MPSFLAIALGIVAALLILVVLLQNKSTGLSATFGGGGSFQATKRGPEKVLAQMTVVLAILFLLLAFVAPLWNPIVSYIRRTSPVPPTPPATSAPVTLPTPVPTSPTIAPPPAPSPAPAR